MQIIGAKEYPTLWVPNLCTMNKQTKIAADIQTILSVKSKNKQPLEKDYESQIKVLCSSTKTSNIIYL